MSTISNEDYLSFMKLHIACRKSDKDSFGICPFSSRK